MNLSPPKKIRHWLEKRRKTWLFMAVLCLMPAPVSSNPNQPSAEACYQEIVWDFLNTFDDTPQEYEEEEPDFSSKNRYKIKITSHTARETMSTVLHKIYGKSPLVEELFEESPCIWSPRTLRDLNITCGPQDNRDHTIINNLDTEEMPYSQGMGFLAKGAMPIHFATSTTSAKELLKKQKIIRILAKDDTLRHRLLEIFGRFKEKHEKSCIAHYDKRHVLRTRLQLKKLERYYAWGKSLAESSLLWLEVFKKLVVEVTFASLLLEAVFLLLDLVHELTRASNGNSHATFFTHHRRWNVFVGILFTPYRLYVHYYMVKETLMPYAEAFLHQKAWYEMVKEVHALVQEHEELSKFSSELLDNTSTLLGDLDGDEDLAYYLYLLESQDLAHFSLFFSFGAKLLKMIGLFEKCCENAYLLNTIYEISTLAVYTHLAHYKKTTEQYKNSLCYTKFVHRKEHPATFFDIKGLWNLGIDPQKAVSNDVYMDGSKANLFFVLGANAGGKTTYSKILPVLSQTYGLSPAKEATQSIFDRILTYFNIEDGDLVKGTSQYTSELDAIEYGLHALHHAGPDKNILWIVDEGAKGTGEDFAKILLQELAKYVVEKYPNSGFFFITHYKDLRTLEKECPFIQNYYAVVLHKDQHTFEYTYKIKKGTPPPGEDMIIAMKILKQRKNFPSELRENINKAVNKKIKK